MNTLKKLISFNTVACLAAVMLLPACAKKEAEPLATAPTELPPIIETGAPVSAPIAAPAENTAGSPDDVVVEVDGRKLVRAQLDQQIAGAMASQGQNLPPQVLPQIAQQMSGRVIEGFIGETVLVNAADKSDISVEPTDVEKALATIEDQLPPGVTLAQAMERSGLNKEELTKNIERDLRVRKLVDQKTADIAEASEEDIKAFYEASEGQFEVEESASTRHILFQAPEEATDEDKAKLKADAESVRQQLVDGGDFVALAKEHSDCPSSSEGGDLGELVRGRTVKPFEDAAFSQDVDAIGDVVETEFGYHIIQVTNRTEAHTQTLDEVRDDVALYLKRQKIQTVMEAYVDALREKATISYGEGFTPQAPPATMPQP